MEAERVHRFINAVREPLGIIISNLDLLGEELSSQQTVGAISDCHESAHEIRQLLEALSVEADNEITQEICRHGKRMSSPKTIEGACECCRGESTARLCFECQQEPEILS